MRRLLIVEPDAGLRSGLVRAVRAAGYEVEELAGSSQASQLEGRLAASRFDAVIMNLSTQCDIQLAVQITGDPSGPAVLALSAVRSVEFAVAALRAGVRAFIRKPFRIETLESRLHDVLDVVPSDSGSERLMLTRDPSLLAILSDAKALASSDVTVQIIGEHGTGKRLLARCIHQWSRRRSGPLVLLDCSTLSVGDADPNLFLATGQDAGTVAAAHGGTLVMNGVGATPLPMQAQLLTLLQSCSVTSVGGDAPPVDIRVITTHDRDLHEPLANGLMREDLHHRLNVVVLKISPLRDRSCDIPLLACHMASRIARSVGCEAPRLGNVALAELAELPLRGNAHELENMMRRAVLLFPGASVEVERLLRGPSRRGPEHTLAESAAGTLNLREIERRTILRSLAETGGNRTHASRALGISVRTLRNKLRDYGVT